MNQPKMFRKKKIPVGRIILIFSAKVQNLAVFSFIYMIRIRFFGPGEFSGCTVRVVDDCCAFVRRITATPPAKTVKDSQWTTSELDEFVVPQIRQQQTVEPSYVVIYTLIVKEIEYLHPPRCCDLHPFLALEIQS